MVYFGEDLPNEAPMLHRRATPGLLLRFGVVVGLIVLPGAGERAPAEEPGATSARSPPSSADELVEQLSNAWFARDFEGVMALWDFDSEEERRAEAAAVREAFASDETRMTVLSRPRHVVDTVRMVTDVQVFFATEPTAKVESWRLFIERRGRRWSFVEKHASPDVEGLVHLPLGPEAWRVRGMLLRLEDFELRMEDGTLFATPESVGRTALVFVGRGRVRFSPRPEAEREQLKQFSGKPELDKAVKWAFVRLNPADFAQLIDTTRLEPDPSAKRRRVEAVKRWTERAPRSFIVDADLPRSPWWLRPGRGDALVDFPWKRNRVLTLALVSDKEENVNLFERDRGLRICSYPSHDRPARSRGSDRRVVDVLHHDLSARFDPSRLTVSAVDTIRLRLLSEVSTLLLKLHDDFRVSSVTTEDGRRLLFLRVREQGSFLVSLGPHARRLDEFSLTVRYGGRHDPDPVDEELLQLFPEQQTRRSQVLLTPPPLVYSNRTAWYPHPGEQDFATLRARFDTPEGSLAVTGGELVSTRRSEGRVHSEYRLREPGKYFTVVVGRVEDVGMRQLGQQTVHGFAAARTEGETRKRMAIAGELLAFYAERFGPCPYPVINLAMAESLVPGGHSPPGLIYLQKRPAILGARALPDDPANFSDMPDFFLAHELAHQWWGQGVAPASYRDQWLSEAWAQYASALWVRHRKGEEAFLDMLERMARWAQRHDDEGPIHLGQRLGHLKRDRRIQRALVYNKGALVLHMLRQILGDEAFFGGARSFLERHRYGTATTEDLRAVLEEAGGRDLEPYFERWIYGTGLPTLEWASRTEQTPNGFETTVQVQPRDLPAPLPLELSVRTSRDREVRRVILGPDGGSWTIVTSDPVRGVRINENRGILAVKKKVRRLTLSSLSDSG